LDFITISLISFFAVVSAFLPPLLDGVERKVRAKIQSRIGPPTVMQTWYDLRKLAVKELKMPLGGELAVLTVFLSLITSVSSIAYLTYVLITSTLNPLSIATLIVLITASHNLTLLSSVSTSNPFSIVGSYRNVTLLLVNEFGFMAGFIATLYALVRLSTNPTPLSFLAYALGLAALIISTYVGCGRLPYDIHEAEPELASGALIEFSGVALGTYLYTHLMMRYVFSLLVAYAISTLIIGFTNALVVIAVLALLTSIIYILYGVVAAMLGRTRVDLGVRTLFTLYVSLTLCLVVAWLFA